MKMTRTPTGATIELTTRELELVGLSLACSTLGALRAMIGHGEDADRQPQPGDYRELAELRDLILLENQPRHTFRPYPPNEPPAPPPPPAAGIQVDEIELIGTDPESDPERPWTLFDALTGELWGGQFTTERQARNWRNNAGLDPDRYVPRRLAGAL